MRDTPEPGDGLAALDAGLTIFALANGVDLTRGPNERRLAWHADGMEREILLTGTPGAIDVAVRAWPYGDAAAARSEAVAQGMGEAEVRKILDRAVEQANRL